MSLSSNEILLCADACPEVAPVAVKDPAIMTDRRVLEQLLGLEIFSMPPTDYFAPGPNSSELQPYMRRVVTTWMLEVDIYFHSFNTFYFILLFCLRLLTSLAIPTFVQISANCERDQS